MKNILEQLNVQGIRPNHLVSIVKDCLGENEDNPVRVLFDMASGIKDMLENERLTESDIPDDYQWLKTKLDALTATELSPTIEGQVAVMKACGWNDETIWGKVLKKYVRPGMRLEVTRPKHKNSTHQFRFAGVVATIEEYGAVVRNMEGESFCIQIDEIEHFYQ